MTTTETNTTGAGPPRVGPIGRLGRWTATHFRTVVIGWVALALVLGALAPRAETALSGAGWEATGSESVQARQLIDRSFGGLETYGPTVVVHSPHGTVSDPGFRRVLRDVERRLQRDPAVSKVLPPRPGTSISSDRRTAVVQAGAARKPDDMVRAAERLKGPLSGLGTAAVQVDLTGAAGMWSDFNHANKSAMMKSELLSWPVTLGILVLASGSLFAAGLPLMLTILGLVAAAGSLWIGTHVAGISIWAMNFALMFALALGIDYALFVVYRFRDALFRSRLPAPEAVAATMDTAGKAVLFSGLTVLVSLSAVMLVPSPAFRSTSVGIMLSVVFVLAATLTLLPAVLAKLGPRIDRFALRGVRSREGRSPRSAAWAERLWRHPLRYGLPTIVLLVALTVPVLSLETGMPSIKVVPSGDSSREGQRAVEKAFGPGATGPIHIVAPAAKAARVAATVERDPGVARVAPPQSGEGGLALVRAIPATGPSDEATGTTIDRLRTRLPHAASVGGPAAENHDLETALSAKTPLVMGTVLGLSFLLLLVALRAPVVAALGVVTNLLATGAAFGLAKWIFQDGIGHSLLGFEPQGFLDAWGPVFFFAMVFAISMDYTVFLLASAKEEWDRSGGDAGQAMVGGMARSGRVIFAAAAVMVSVFLTFALSGPLPPKEMGVILGLAVLLDAALVRLLLMPVLLRLLGRWAWHVPKPFGRLLPAARPVRVRRHRATSKMGDGADAAGPARI
ncbi:MAG TPA: MMPL family transporter [Thermoleophilaceae bacterium]|nr:MMPL family transporter [Thermoleophilaceae bacterium]